MSANTVSVDEESLKSDLRELVRKTVQETLNALLDEEADEMVGAERYERTAAREAYRSGHYKRKLVTISGEVVLDVPKLRGAKVVREGCAETLSYTDPPMQHWTRIRTNNAIERLNREIRADAGDRQAEIHSRERVGPQALPRRIAARREGGQDAGR